MSGIAWPTAALHAIAGAAAIIVINAFGAPLLWLAVPALAALGIDRAIRLTKKRYGLRYKEAADFVWLGEPGGNPWNLRLQAAGWGIGALLMALLIAAMDAAWAALFLKVLG